MNVLEFSWQYLISFMYLPTAFSISSGGIHRTIFTNVIIPSAYGSADTLCTWSVLNFKEVVNVWNLVCGDKYPIENIKGLRTLLRRWLSTLYAL